MAVGDATARQIVWGELHLDLVAGKDADVVLAHLSGDRREDIMAAVELDAEHRARQRLGHLTFDLDLLFLVRQSPRFYVVASGDLCAYSLRRKRHGLRRGKVMVPGPM